MSNQQSNFVLSNALATYSNSVNARYVLSNQQSNFVLSNALAAYSNSVNSLYVLSNQQSNFVLSNTFITYSNFVNTQYAFSNTLTNNSNGLWAKLTDTSNFTYPDRYWTINASNVFTNSNVGIGTNTPLSLLDVSGTMQISSNTLLSETWMRDTGLYMRFQGDRNHGIIMHPTLDGPRVFGLQGGALGVGSTSNALVWRASGIGIGTSNPAYRLDVIGDINAESNITSSNMLVRHNISVGNVPSPLAPIHLSNNPGVQRQLLLYSLSNNDHEYFGLGIGVSNTSNLLRYQSCYGDHVFTASRTNATSYDVMKIGASGRVDVNSNALYVAGTHVVFGRNYFYTVDTTITTVANSTYASKVTITQTFEAGTYFIISYGEYKTSVTVRWAQVSTTVDGTEVSLSEVNLTNINQYTQATHIHQSVLTAGSHTIILRFRRATYGTQTGTISCRNAKLAIWRVQ